MQQLEWRERLADLKGETDPERAIKDFRQEIRHDHQLLMQQLTRPSPQARIRERLIVFANSSLSTSSSRSWNDSKTRCSSLDPLTLEV